MGEGRILPNTSAQRRSTMDLKDFGSHVLIRLDPGDDVVESVKQAARDCGVKLGMVAGIGAVNKAIVGLFDPVAKEYHSTEMTENFEIGSLTGNVSTMKGETYVHLHAVLTNADYKAVGGHLNAALVSCTAEIIISKIEGEIDREYSEEIGLNLITF
jgi:hypothetical protein